MRCRKSRYYSDLRLVGKPLKTAKGEFLEVPFSYLPIEKQDFEFLLEAVHTLEYLQSIPSSKLLVLRENLSEDLPYQR